MCVTIVLQSAPCVDDLESFLQSQTPRPTLSVSFTQFQAFCKSLGMHDAQEINKRFKVLKTFDSEGQCLVVVAVVVVSL
jgi:hypothetical protein